MLPCTGTGIPATDPLDIQTVHRRQEAAVDRLPEGEDATAAEAAGMKNPMTAKAQPANHIVVNVDLAAVTMPTLPARLR